MQAIRKEIDELTEVLHDLLVPSTSQKRTTTQKPAKLLLTPKAIFALYQQEREHFDAYAQGWQQAVTDLHDLEQLFIVS